ncbi:MAG: MBL fold metallo-hydrolase [Armatimonadetes bacterium]|nr:MBL fold metallo-hydrolase [Armatimonadota bacterium]
MKLHFLGAAKTVTGSQYLLETLHGHLMVDCGMYQGPDHLREQTSPVARVPAEQVRALLLTHAHIDHSGHLPWLVRLGYRGPIFATAATTDLCDIMLADSAHIQEEDARQDLRKWQKRGHIGPPPEPLYTQEDVPPTMALFQPVRYGEMVEVIPGVRARWRDAGHILGAACIEVWVEENGRETKIIFSGDIGQTGRPLIRDPEVLDDADFVITESTYGNRRHEDQAVKLGRLLEIIQRTIRNRSHIIVPAFAVGRTQELLYELNALVEQHEISRFPVYVDSPLATAATEVYSRHRECLDAETRALLDAGDDPLDFRGLHFTREVSESMALNQQKGPFMIISASGMATAGRIRHHLAHHLEHGDDTLLIVGFQAVGTLGRLLHDGATRVKLMGHNVRVRARVVEMLGYSAHADAEGLLAWLEPIEGPRAVFVLHGEEPAALDYAALAHRRLGAPTLVPDYGETVDLDNAEEIAFRLGQMESIWRRPAIIRQA